MEKFKEYIFEWYFFYIKRMFYNRLLFLGIVKLFYFLGLNFVDF